jgi:hypothetical protein
MKKWHDIYQRIKAVATLPACAITLDRSEDGRRLYAAFTRRHPRMPLLRAKTHGVALIHLRDFPAGAAYLESVGGKNSAAYFTRKALRAGYIFQPVDLNDHVGEIDAIHRSAPERQGKAIDPAYVKRLDRYPVNEHNAYYGIVRDGKLVAYLWVVRSGQLALLNRIMGHADYLRDGIMYMLVTSYIAGECDAGGQHVVMYDTWFGASEGLRLFKSRCGFRPFRVIWKMP